MPPLALFVPLLATIGITGVAATIISGVLVAGIDIGASLLIGAIAQALTPAPGLKSTLSVGLSANDPRRCIIGRAATAGSLITFQTWGNNNEFIVLLFRVADHKCQGLAPQISVTGSTVSGSITVTVSSSAGMTVGMPFGGRGVGTGAWITAILSGTSITISQQATGSFSGSNLVANASVYWGGNPMNLGAGGAVPFFFADGHDNCWVTFSNGDWNQTADADMVANSNGRWTSADRGRGVAYVKVKARANAKAFPAGLSQLFQFVFVIDGMALYDRRADSSVGGSGSQRFDDQSTWAISSNAAVVAENLLRGIRVEDTTGAIGSRAMDTFFGLALTDGDLPFNENIAAMNHCDETIALLAGGTEPRYRCNGVIAPNQGETFKTALGDVLITMSGKLVQSPARIFLMAGVTQTPVRTFADTDWRIDGPYKYVNDIPLDTVCNAVTGEFSDPASMYSAQPLPPRISTADALTDGGYKASQLDLSFVTSQTQGQRIQEIARRRQRLQITAQVAVMPENLDLEPCDWLTWNSARWGTGFDYEIVQSDPKGTADDAELMMIVLDLAQTDPSLFTWVPATDELNRFAPAILPSADPVSGSVTTLTAVAGTLATVGSGLKPAIFVTCDALTDPTVVGVRFQYQATGSGAPSQLLIQDFEVNQAAVSGTQSFTLTAGVVAGWQYEVQAAPIQVPPQDLVFTSFVTTSGKTGELITAPSLPINLGNGQAFSFNPAAPLSSSSTTTITVAASTLSYPGQTLSLPSGTITGLTAGTIYAVFYDLVATAYIALSTGATAKYVDPSRYVSMGSQSTQTSGGGYTPPPSPPGGGGGGRAQQLI